MKTVITIQGTGGIGKSSAVRAIYNRLAEAGTFTILGDRKDIRAEGTYKGKLIGIEGEGDPPGYFLEKSLGEFAAKGCDIIICTCRTRGETPDIVANMWHDHRYHIIWTKHLQEGKTGIMPNGLDLSKKYAEMVMDLIDAL